MKKIMMLLALAGICCSNGVMAGSGDVSQSDAFSSSEVLDEIIFEIGTKPRLPKPPKFN